jgi:hypothetical protein
MKILSIVCLVGIFFNQRENEENNPVLVKAIFYLHINDTRKISKGNLTVEVIKSEKLLAHNTFELDKVDRNVTDYQTELTIDMREIEKKDCLGYLVKIQQDFKKSGIQKFDARVELYLSNGYIISAAKENIELKKENEIVEFNAF